MQDAHGDVEELLLAYLEELVAGVGLEDLDEVLLVVAAVREPGPLHHVPHLAPHDGHLEDAHAVGGEGVEPQEPPLAGYVSALVELFDANVVHVGGAVDGRAGVGLGEVEEVRPAGEAAHLGRQLGEGARAGLAAGLSEDAEARVLHAHKGVVAVLGAQVVLAVAEVGEVVVRDPREKGPRLCEVVPVKRRRVLLEGGHHLGHALEHRRPVLDGGPHLREHALGAGAEFLEDLGLRLAVYLYVDHGLRDGALVFSVGR